MCYTLVKAPSGHSQSQADTGPQQSMFHEHTAERRQDTRQSSKAQAGLLKHHLKAHREEKGRPPCWNSHLRPWN